ncbi:MAG: substrate-binding domain-containing protein, partial [Collinsella sp.]|nr:substrate-binding domain-containing protein [Collinsella sp.]
SDGLPQNDLDLIRLLMNRGVDGVFLVVANEVSQDGKLVEELEGLSIPFVLVDRVIEGLPCDKALFDHELGGYMATRHLLERGHRRIACLVNAERSMTGRLRLAGYRRALTEAGISPDPALEFESEYYIPSAYEASEGLMGTGATAVFASSDNIALGLLKRLYELGLRVPGDVSVVSYDNSAADALFEPALTSIDQNVSELSTNALELMLGRLSDPSTPPECRLLEPRLIVRESVSERP